MVSTSLLDIHMYLSVYSTLHLEASQRYQINISKTNSPPLSLQISSFPLVMHLLIHYFIQHSTYYFKISTNGSVISLEKSSQKLGITHDCFLRLYPIFIQPNTNLGQSYLLCFPQICPLPCTLTRTILVKITVTSCQDYSNSLFSFFPSDLLLSEPFFTLQQKKSWISTLITTLCCWSPLNDFPKPRGQWKTSPTGCKDSLGSGLTSFWAWFLGTLPFKHTLVPFFQSLYWVTLSLRSFHVVCPVWKILPHTTTFLCGQFLTIFQFPVQISFLQRSFVWPRN